MDHPAPLLKDPFMTMANRTTAEWQRKVKEDKRRRKQQKLQAREQREETDSDNDDDDDNEEYDMVVADIEWAT